MSTRIGILHPGQMGASVGAAALAAGAHVSWASQNRGAATRQRAAAAGLEDGGSLANVVSTCDVLISVCPPASAVAVATSVAALGFDRTYVDANAVAPQTALEIASVVREAGARFVDGGIIGPPAHKGGTTRLYLSGTEAPFVASLFEDSALEGVAMDPTEGSASSLKVCYAAWTKGSSALLIAVRSLAAAEDVESSLLGEWALSKPGLEVSSGKAVKNNAFKAWRFAGEMREIANSFEAAGLPGGFHGAAAEIYDRLESYKNCDPAPDVSEAVATILASARPGSQTNFTSATAWTGPRRP